MAFDVVGELCLLFVIGIIVFVISLVGVITAVRVPNIPLYIYYMHTVYLRA